MNTHHDRLGRRRCAAWWVVCAWISVVLLVVVGLVSAAGML